MIGFAWHERLRLSGAVLVLLACAAMPGAARAAGDVGLYTAVQGKAVYQPADSMGKEARASLEAMMKARRGDVVTVEKGGTVRLVYFATGRQEAWTGPVSFAVGDAESTAQGDAKPALLQLPKGAARRLDRLPGPMPGTPIRAGETEEAKPVELASWELEKIAVVRAEYEQLRAQTAVDDITPELYLVSVLAVYDQRGEVAKIVAEARKRAPGHPALEKIENWLKGTGEKE